MTGPEFVAVLKLLKKISAAWRAPIIDLMAQSGQTPFTILIGTLLSARTKDQTTAAACTRLFARADTPQKMLKLSRAQIALLVRPVGFFQTKAKHILGLCRILIDRFASQVPQTREELMLLPGVGRKTANLVLAQAFNQATICVDVHVQRITNRLGVLKSTEPLDTELKLMKLVPQKWWRDVNSLLVAFGQTLCLPVKPRCPICPILNCPSRRV